MNWQITTRNAKTGATETLYIEAVDRDEVFAELTKRGIKAMRVKMMDGQKPKAMANAVPRDGGGKSGMMKGLLALLVIVAGAFAAWYFIFGSGDASKEESKETTKKEIVEATPAPAATAKVAEEKKEDKKVDEKDLPPQKVGETRNGYILLPSGRLHKVRGVITNSVSATQFKGKYEIFDFHCENEIACLLTIEPGETLVGTPIYNGRFVKQFLESLKTPIIIKADDSEEDKELKRNVIQAKKELKEAYDRGEDIEKIMLDTRKEFQDLARYKMELKSMIYDYKKQEGVSNQDVEDYVQAANKLLEQKGIAPMNIGPITRQKLRSKMIQERKNRK